MSLRPPPPVREASCVEGRGYFVAVWRQGTLCKFVEEGRELCWCVKEVNCAGVSGAGKLCRCVWGAGKLHVQVLGT